ncbi:MAG: DMT family transporter [Bdellovibrionota bacterium]|jgi:transporter family-2 protein|nr:DMT family transporter [Bdellovibrionota bacterium]
MNWTYLIPIAVGVSGILQGGFNRNMSDNLGLSHALLLGNILVLLYSVFLLIGVFKFPEALPEMFRLKAPLTEFKWWYIIPSICGFIIITGIPLGISKIGAVKVTVLIVVAQMVTSILWDLFVEKLPVNAMKTLGLFFSLIAVACTLYS